MTTKTKRKLARKRHEKSVVAKCRCGKMRDYLTARRLLSHGWYRRGGQWACDYCMGVFMESRVVRLREAPSK